MKKRRTFSAKQKASIVLETLKESNSMVEICKKYQLSPSVLERWRNQFLNNIDKAFGTQADKEQTKKIQKYEHIITKLTTQNDFLERVLATLE
jgi:transposase-like protein